MKFPIKLLKKIVLVCVFKMLQLSDGIWWTEMSNFDQAIWCLKRYEFKRYGAQSDIVPGWEGFAI